MADKPRVKAPKQRAGPPTTAAVARERWQSSAGSRGRARACRRRGRARDGRRWRKDRRRGAAGCVSRRPAARCRSLRLSRVTHSIRARAGLARSGTPIPRRAGPTTGSPAIFGIYNEELEMARVVHNLEHGGIYILYGKDVPDSTVEELRAFYDDAQDGHDHGAARPAGDKFALGAWVVDGETQAASSRSARRSMRARSRRSSARSSSAGLSDSIRVSSSRACSRAYTRPRRGGGTGETRPP